MFSGACVNVPSTGDGTTTLTPRQNRSLGLPNVIACGNLDVPLPGPASLARGRRCAAVREVVKCTAVPGPHGKRRFPRVSAGTVGHMAWDTEDLISVGRVQVPVATAEAWVRDYTNEERSRASSAPYAYPAYGPVRRGDQRPTAAH